MDPILFSFFGQDQQDFQDNFFLKLSGRKPFPDESLESSIAFDDKKTIT